MSRKKKKSTCNKNWDKQCCETCANCIPIGEGDHICSMNPTRIVLEDYSFSDNYFWCGGSFWEEGQMDEYDWADQERLVRQDVEEIEKQMKEEQERGRE